MNVLAGAAFPRRAYQVTSEYGIDDGPPEISQVVMQQMMMQRIVMQRTLFLRRPYGKRKRRP